MPDRSKARSQTKSDPLAMQVGGWALDQSSPGKRILLQKQQSIKLSLTWLSRQYEQEREEARNNLGMI